VTETADKDRLYLWHARAIREEFLRGLEIKLTHHCVRYSKLVRSRKLRKALLPLFICGWCCKRLDLINTKKAFKKLYMFYFKTFRIILNLSSVKK